MSSQDIEGDASQDGEVLGSVILARSGAVFVEDDIERPMKLVLDAPMRSHDPQKAPWIEDLREGGVMNLCSGPGVGGSLGLDPAESDEAGKGRRGGRNGDDAGPSPLAPPVSAFGLLLERKRAGCVRVGEGLLDTGEERPVVRLEPERIVAAARPHRLGHGGMAMQRVSGDGAALEVMVLSASSVAAISLPPGAWRAVSDRRVSASKTLTMSGGMKARPRS